MPADDKRLVFLAFLFACVPALICPVIIPQLRLTFFAPFLALMFYKRPLSNCLWYSLFCGLVLDLLSAQTRLGIYPLSYLFTTWILFHQKKHFFEDKILTLPVMTFLFAVLSTSIQILMLRPLVPSLSLSVPWILTDLLLMPLADAFYALVWFALPAYLLRRRPQGRDNTLCFRTER